MTKEEARREIDSLDFYLQNHTDDYGEESHTAMMMAIKALEKEPCDDCISRQAATDALKKISFSHWFECGEYLSEDTREIEIINSNKAFEAIEALPSVNSRPKTGHWIDHSDEGYVECSECGSATNCDGNIADLHFCFSCGAKMEGEE